MRINKIILKNYRQYRDVEFEFPKTTKYDVHILIAKNGVGKTTLLNAINWCLYGDEPHTSGRGSSAAGREDTLALVNLNAIQEIRNENGQLCEASVVIEAEDDDSFLTFSRKQTMNVDSLQPVGKDIEEIEERSKRTGKTEFHRGTDFKECIGRYFPKEIREYFFFDADQMEDYFKDNGKDPRLKRNIYQIAQVDVISEVEDRLGHLLKDFEKAIRDTSPDLKGITDALTGLQKEIDDKKEQIDQLSAQIREAGETIKELDRKIGGQEHLVEWDDEYKANDARIHELNAQLEEERVLLAKFVREYTVRLFLRDANLKTSAYIEERQKSQSVSPINDINILKKSLSDHKCAVCGSELDEQAEESFSRLVARLEGNASMQKLYEIMNDVRRGIDVSHYEEDKKARFDRINALEGEIKAKRLRNDVLHEKLLSNSPEIIAGYIDQRKTNKRLREQNIEKRADYKAQLERFKVEYDKKKAEQDAALRKNKKCEGLRQRYNFATRARSIIQAVKEGIVNDVKKQLQDKTMQLFEQFIWKRHTYDRVELDDSFQLVLYDKVTQQSCIGSTSGAENELLALAFTLAIQEVSNFDNLLFIDTPVGKISDENRENFANVLLDISTHKQIILQFTPSEYSPEIRDVFRDNVVSSAIDIMMVNEHEAIWKEHKEWRTD